MEDEFRIVISAKRRGGSSKGATGLRELFRAELEEIGSPNPCWLPRDVSEVSSVSTSGGKKILGSDEISSHNSSTSDEDGISSSVRNLLKLLVKRASTQLGQETSCVDEDEVDLCTGGDRTIGADESWSSSMATPSKNRSLFCENNRSPAIDLNLEISKLEVENSSLDGDLLIRRLSCGGDETESPKSNFVFYGFEDSLVDVQLNSKLDPRIIIDPFDPESLSSNLIDPVEALFFLKSLISSINESAQVELVDAAKTSDHELLRGLCFVVPSFHDKALTEVNDVELLGRNLGKRLEASEIGHCDTADSCVLRELEVGRSSSGNEMCPLKKLTMVGNDADVKGQVESCNAHGLLLIKSNPFCSHKESASRVPLSNQEVCSADLSSAVNAKKEPEYVTQILNLLCSPPGGCNSSHGVRKRKMDDVEGKQIENSPSRKESLWIVGELLEELLEKMHTKLGKVEINSSVCKHNVLIAASNTRNCSFECSLNRSMGERHDDATSDFEKVKLEENSHKILVEELLRDAVANMSFNSEGEQWSNTHSDAGNMNDKSPSPKLVRSTCRKQNIAIASSEGYSNTLQLSSNVPVHMLATSSDVREQSYFPVNIHKTIHAPPSECEVPTDPQPIFGESVETKVEPENEKDLIFMGSQDFLSGSVLEEVCQASEALAYFGKMKTDCLAGLENHDKSPGTSSNLSREKAEEDKSVVAAKSYGEHQNISGEGMIIDTCANHVHDGPSISKTTSSSHDLVKHNAGCLVESRILCPGTKNNSHQGGKVVSEKTAKKKIVFNVADCPESCDFESGFDAEDDLYPEVLWKSKEKHGSLTLSMPNDANISSSKVGKCLEAISHGHSNKFVYPKHRSQSGIWMPKVVAAEDLMSRAAQLEKYSSLSSSNGKSNLTRLKIGTLMSFSSLDHTEYNSVSGVESELLYSKKESGHSEGSIFLEKDRPILMVEHYGGPESIQGTMKRHNRVSGTKEMENCGTEMVDKQEVATLKTSEKKIEPDITEREELKPLSLVNEFSLIVEASKTEHRIEVIERGEMCTSPILSKKFRKKKPFRRRNRHQINTSTPKAKTKMAHGMKECLPESGLVGEKFNKVENVEKNFDTDVGDDSCILADKYCDQNESTEIGNLSKCKSKLQSVELSKMAQACKEKTDLRQCSLDFERDLPSEILSSAGDINSDPLFALTNGKKSPSTFLNEKACGKDSTPVSSNDPVVSVSSGFKGAASKSSLNETSFTDDFDPWEGVDDADFPEGCQIKNNAAAKAVLKTNILHSIVSNPIRDDFSLNVKKVEGSEKSVTQTEASILTRDHSPNTAASDLRPTGDLSRSYLSYNLHLPKDSTPVRSDALGFSTASGKKVAVSESSLHKAIKLFSEDVDLQDSFKDIDLSPTNGGKVDNSSKALSKVKSISGEIATPRILGFPGFSSASGKKVAISEKSLAQARKLFGEEVSSFEEKDVIVSPETIRRTQISNVSKPHATISEDSTPVRSDVFGFSTASGKKMAVSESSLNKARKLFSEDLNLLDSYKASGLSPAISEIVGKSSRPHGKEKNKSGEVSTPGTSGFSGFSSASGKKVAISEKSLAQARKLFGEEVSSFEEKDVIVSPGTIGRTQISNVSKPHATISEDSTPIRSDVFGFSTASGKKMAVSESSLSKARKLFSEDLNLLDSYKASGLSPAISEIVGKSSRSHGKEKNKSGEVSTPGTSGFSGFSSASGKKVAISEKSLAQARKLFAEEVSSFEETDVGLIKSYRTKESNVAKPLVKKNVAPEVSTPVRSDTSGFSTASGKKVAVSEGSLDKARKLFSEDIDLLDRSKASGLSPATSVIMDNSSKSLLKVKNISGEISTPGTSGFPGFSSASGKKVTITEKSLAQARKLFAEEVSSFEENNGNQAPLTSRKAGISNFSIPLLKANFSISENSTPTRPKTPGFSTASGKKVAVSESSLNKARKLFSEDIDLPGSSENFGLSPAPYGKVVSSSKSLSKVYNMPSEFHTPGISEFPGFSSASGKKVTISEKSLAQARKLFDQEVGSLEEKDGTHCHITSSRTGISHISKPILECNLPLSEDSTPVPSDALGFSTASGKKLAVSESSLHKARKLFCEDMDFPGSSKNLGFSPVPIEEVDNSYKSISEFKRKCSEISTPGTCGFPGFSSASGKKFAISEKSLAQARKLFAEEGNSLETTDGVFLSSANLKKAGSSVHSLSSVLISSSKNSTPLRPKFEGFSSASGKKVVVSEKSLLNAKKLFSDEISDNQFSNKTGAVCCGGFHLDGAGRDEPVSCFEEPKEVNTGCFTANENTLVKGDNLSTSSSCQKSTLSFSICENEVSSEIALPKDTEIIADPSSSNSVKQGKDFDFQVPLCDSDPSQFKHNTQVVKSDHGDNFSGNGKLNVAQNNDVFLAESQGDDYIKAVDVKTLDSPATLVDQNPPSPVFKTTKKRRQKLKRFCVKRKSEGSLGTPSSSKFNRKSLCNGYEDFDEKSDSLKSSQSSVLTQDQESSERGKYSDLWDGDIADESWLGKQLEFAEENTLGVKSGQGVDYWVEGRKLQSKAISAKVNVKPVIGHCLKLRRGVGQLRRSLRDFVKGKRPGRYSKDQLRLFGVREEVISITSENAVHFKFKIKDYYEELIRSDGVLLEEGFRVIPDEKGMFGIVEAQSALLAGPGVDPKLLPAGDWCRNHYRWIVWKLASYEKSFPQDFGGRCLTPENVMCQLKYRWDREIDCGERSAIRKILEKDDTASKRMVLCVSGIKKPALPESSNKLELDLLASSSLLELTDGWYSISGIVDSELAHLMKSGHLTIGTKIVTSGAELINGPPNGCYPLEAPASLARIRLFANSTRRAKWDAKLGYVCSHPGPLPIFLHSILPGGGAIGLLNDVILARVYPMLSIEKTSDGRRVTRSKRAEAKAAAKYELERQAWLESVYIEVSAEMQRELEEEAAARRQKGKRVLPGGTCAGRSSKRPRIGHSMHGGYEKSEILSFKGEMVAVEELSRLVDETGDPSEVQKMLTSSQVDMISAYRQESRDNFQKELEERVKQKIRQEEEKLASNGKTQDSSSAHSSLGRKNRDVVNLLKVRLVDAKRPIIPRSAVLTIWRPSEDVISLLAKEGSILKIYGATANGMRSNFIQFSSGKHTRYKLKKSQTLIESSCPTLRREILRRGFDSGQGCNSPQPPFGEIDLIAMVIRVEEIPKKGKHQGFQHVYVAGSDGSLLSISFWGGIQEFAVEDFLYRGSVIVALNLQWRRLHGLHRIATAQAVETSSFTLNPQEERLKKALRDFKLEIEAEKELQLIAGDFIHSCEQKLDAVLGHDCEEVSASCLRESISEATKPLSPVTAPAPKESIGSVRPSVAARMKKLQMYEGSPEISLPTCHLRKSASVIKAFNPPKKCSDASTSSSHERKSFTSVMERCQSPQCYDSERTTVSVSVSENKNFNFPDADSPPMSLDSDPQE